VTDKKMNATDFIICCRRLVGALRQPPAAGEHATFFLGFDAQGLPFYKAGSFNAGQLTSAFTEPLFFCPFCGRRVREGGRDESAARPRVAERDEEQTLPAATRTDDRGGEFETFIASRREYDSAARAGAGRLTGEAPRASLH